MNMLVILANMTALLSRVSSLMSRAAQLFYKEPLFFHNKAGLFEIWYSTMMKTTHYFKKSTPD